MSVGLLANILYKDQAALRTDAVKSVCVNCITKDAEIQELRRRLQQAQDRICQLERRSNMPFGSNTPSSKIVHKPSAENAQAKRGGAKPGHKGKTRGAPKAAHEARRASLPEHCPDCGGTLLYKRDDLRRLIDVERSRLLDLSLLVERGKCKCCQRSVSAPVQALPRSLIGNRLLAELAVSHYLRGIPMGTLMAQYGISNTLSDGTIWHSMYRLGGICQLAEPALIEDFRRELVRFADETSWRTDGRNGYLWLFSTLRTSIYIFGASRASAVPKRILGDHKLPGVLVVDRYAGYNSMPLSLQYCLAHLLRDLKDLQEEFSEVAEIARFCEAMIPLFASAISLRGLPIKEEEYYRRAREISDAMLDLSSAPSQHLGVRSFQDLILDEGDRLFMWTKDRSIPAHNNFSEGQIRRTVISRKVSFGSQSEKGAKTRSAICSLLGTAEKRVGNGDKLVEWLTDALNEISWQPKTTIYDLLARAGPISQSRLH